MNYFIVLLLLSGVIILIISRRVRASGGLPPGRVIHIDPTMHRDTASVLFDPKLNLAGRPDYLIRRGSETIPVEMKSGTSMNGPYEAHVIQLGAYCHLVETEFGTRPSCGIIQYRNSTFEVDYTDSLQRKLMKTLREIRRASNRAPKRSHSFLSRCRSCGFSVICDQALG